MLLKYCGSQASEVHHTWLFMVIGDLTALLNPLCCSLTTAVCSPLLSKQLLSDTQACFVVSVTMQVKSCDVLK